MTRVNRLETCHKSNNPSPRDLRGKYSNRSNKILDNILRQIDDQNVKVTTAENQTKMTLTYHQI